MTAVVKTSGQDETRVRATLNGDSEEVGEGGACLGEESRVIVVEHECRAPLRRPPVSDRGTGGRGRGRGRGVGDGGEVGQGRIVRMRRQRPATSRYAAGALRAMERELPGSSATGGGEGVT